MSQVVDFGVRTAVSRSLKIAGEVSRKVTGALQECKTLTAGELSKVEEAAYQFGLAPESYDVVRSSGSLLQTPCGKGFLNVYEDGRFWHMPGGIIGDETMKPATVRWLKQLADEKRRTVAVYSVGRDEVPLFQEAGYEVNKFGEEPVIDLGDLNWEGKAYEWVRRQTNFCVRQGLEVQEITSVSEQLALAEVLQEIFYDDLRDRVYSKPLRLLEGEFDPRAMGRRRLFLAKNKGTGRIEGFLAASPMNGGKSWAFETYRKRQDSVRGTIPFLFREITDRLQREGAETVSLCLVPGKGVQEDPSASADWRVRWILDLWYRRLDLIFSASGQDYFKSRFRPRYVDRYICVYPTNSWISIASFAKTSGAFQINGGNLLRRVGQAMWRKAG